VERGLRERLQAGAERLCLRVLYAACVPEVLLPELQMVLRLAAMCRKKRILHAELKCELWADRDLIRHRQRVKAMALERP
jgi:hypothetical protein